MKRIVVMTVALAIGAWWWSHARGAQPTVPDMAKTERVLADLAAYGGDLQWETTNGHVPGQHGVEFRTTQDTPASIRVAFDSARIDTQTWRVIVNLRLVTEVVCERHFIHEPQPPLILLYVSFRKGSDDDAGFPDTLFTVRFDQAREADFIALCERHGLRKDGW